MKKKELLKLKIENMKAGVGLRITAMVFILMLSYAGSFAQDFTRSGNLIKVGIFDIDIRDDSAPVFADIDGDNDLDLYVGESDGNINVFINDGSGNFTYVGFLQADGIDINVGIDASPIFADIDGDNDLDLYVGEDYFEDGKTIKVFINDGSGNFTSAGNLQADGSDIDVGSRPSPEFADIDNDGDLDLYVGEEDGYINVFINDGSGLFSAAGKLQADGSDIHVIGMSSPVFVNIDGDSDLDLYVGEDDGYIIVFTNDGNGNFTEIGNLQAGGSDIDVGHRCKPAFADIDGDSDLDLYVGEWSGNINVFVNEGGGSFTVVGDLPAYGSDIIVGGYSSPVYADIDVDNDLDLYVGAGDGTIKVLTNDGSGNFTDVGNLQASGSDIDVGGLSSPVFADIDNDNDLDLYVGAGDGTIKVFTNDGSGNFTDDGNLQAGGSDIDVGNGSSPEFANIDSDNDLDLYVGESEGYIKVFTNDGSGNFTYAGNLQADGSDILVETLSTLDFADIDSDNDLDLYVSQDDEDGRTIKVFTNDGSGNFTDAGNLQADGSDIDAGYSSSPVFADIDGCPLNLYIGNNLGEIAVYLGIDVTNPTVICVDNQEVNADVTETYTVSGTEFDPVATDDNCGVESVINDFNNSATLAGAVLPTGTTTIVWTVTDAAENNANCSFEVLVNEYVDIEELKEINISIYPNPTNGEITIDFYSSEGYESMRKIEITDITGKTVYTSTTLSASNNQLKVNLSSFEKGIYIISIQIDKEIFTSKIVNN